jgi:hypothetical protein
MPWGNERFFPASYDKTTKIISAVVCAILVVVVLGTQSTVAAGVGVLVLVLAYGWSPRGYAVSDGSILVKRLMGNARVRLEGVREARPATGDDFRGCIRLWGDGGLFGYYGVFRTSKLGTSTWYLTNRSNAAVVITADKTALFSPDDREGFLAAVRAEVGTPLGPPVEAARPYDRQNRIRAGALVGVAIGAIALGFAMFAVMYSPGIPQYTLTPESLTIHDRFYPVTVQARDVDVAQIRVIDTDTDSRWRPTERTNGFSNAHYHSGWYRVAGGERVRLYTANGGRVVLLPPKGGSTAVLLEVQDPEEFVERVRREWGGA